MRFIHPNLIDVVETWSEGTAVFSNTFGELSNEIRFWPALKFERSILNFVFAYHSQLYFLYFSIMLAVTAYIMFTLLQKKTLTLTLSVCMIGIFYLSPVTVDTYWRLGAAETLFTLFLVSSIYTLLTEKYGWTIVFLAGLMATKESAIFYIPIYAAAFLIQKQYKAALILTTMYIGFCMKMYQLVHYALTHKTYTGMLTTTLQGGMTMISHIISFHAFYMMTLWITIILFAYRMYWMKEKSHHKSMEFGYIFFALNAAGICTLLAFRNVFQSYYAFPWLVTVVLWLIWELQYTTQNIIRGVLMVLLFLFCIMRMPEQTLWKMVYWQHDYAGDNALIEAVLDDRETRFRFMREYRPEYTPGLEYLMRSSDRSVYTATVFLASNEQSYPNAQPLCMSTFFEHSYCKWGVIRHE